MEFDYFYGPEDAEQYQFYRIPKLLITSEQFKDVSVESKLLYGLMLDRLSLSIKNGWFDSLNRAYIIYTVEDVIELQEAARVAFDQLPEGTKLPTVKELNAERIRLIKERQEEYAEYRKVRADRTEFIRAKQNADVILKRQQEERDERTREK